MFPGNVTMLWSVELPCGRGRKKWKIFFGLLPRRSSNQIYWGVNSDERYEIRRNAETDAEVFGNYDGGEGGI
jgi:hypothetical protein